MKNFNIPKEVLNILNLINKAGFSAYLVGGCIRDLLLNKIPKDYDICTSAMPEDTINIFKDKYLIVTKGITFGTINIISGDNEYEITTFRKESDYEDHRHPGKVELVSDIKFDLSRRDFTINAMAYDPINDVFIDLFNGQEDLKNKIIKTVGDPEKRFDEDALRIVRALRFAITLEYEIEEKTFEAMIKKADSLIFVSKERITNEFIKILSANKPVKYWFMKAKDIIFKIIPDLRSCYKFDQNNKYHRHDVYEHILYVVDFCDTNDFEIKMAALLHDIGKPFSYTEDNKGHGHFYGHPKVSYDISTDLLAFDFRLTNEQYNMITKLILYHDYYMGNDKKNVKKAMAKFDDKFMRKWFILKQADIDDHVFPDDKKVSWGTIDNIIEMYNEILEENACVKISDLAINGDDVIKITGFKPGKEIGIILNLLLEAVIDEEIENNYEQLRDYMLHKILYN